MLGRALLTNASTFRFSFVQRIRLAASALLACVLFAHPAVAAQLNVMKMGQGYGTVSSNPIGISCGTTCGFNFPSGNVILSVTFNAADTRFAGWQGTGITCPGIGDCTVDMSVAHNVRAVFEPRTAIATLDACGPSAAAPNDCSPENIQAFLDANPNIDTAAEFIAALPPLYKENWILMNRSESLQTGVALYPRILMPSHDARFVFSFGLKEHDSFPGSHRNAIEYMQWDVTRKNFRFHEIVLDTIPEMHIVGGRATFPQRNTRMVAGVEVGAVTADDPKCTKCHSTRDVPNTDSTVYGTAPFSATRDASKAKNKPNWDAYDSWGGMTPFNRDRIYQGSVEEATFRYFFNLWNWRGSADNDSIRQVLEQLQLQPLNLVSSSKHTITRDLNDTTDAGHLEFGYEKPMPPAAPSAGPAPNSTNYNFNNVPGSGGATTVNQEGRYVTLRHSGPPGSMPGLINETYASPVSDEGRGVQLFDLLGGLDGQLNARRIVDELINHRYATSDIQIDVRPIALAIARGYVTVDAATNTIRPVIATDLAFFNNRNGLTVTGYNSINDLVADTRRRAESLPRRKADIQKFNLDRTTTDGTDTDANPDPDPYLATADIGQPDSLGLIQQYAPGLAGTPDVRRREIFRRSIDLGGRDNTDIGRVAVDRETHGSNTRAVALFRYFLEPLGVPVDKWSMSVRGRSRAYNFADVFGRYASLNPRLNYTDPVERARMGVLEIELIASLQSNPPSGFTVPGGAMPFTPTEANILTAVDNTLAPALLPDVSDTPRNIPTYTDIQRIFNKSCIECHGGLNYLPYYNHGFGLDLSEQETAPMPPLMDPRWNRMNRAYTDAVSRTAAFMDDDMDLDFDEDDDGIMDGGGGSLYRKIARLTNEDCPHNAAGITRGLMPCGGPSLSKTDIETITRWIAGGTPKTAGDPHLRTVGGIDYDFQAAGEFVLLTEPGLEIQARHTAIEGTAPYGPNPYTGLTSCVSVNSAVALRVGNDRVTYQSSPQGVQLRIDGKLWNVSSAAIPLPSGGRIIRTPVPDGIQIEAPGGTKVILTPYSWPAQQLWYMTIDVQHARGTHGLLGAIAPANWLPALPDGTLLGPKPKSLAERYRQLYTVLGNAWRVNDTTSLFDYAPGTSTRRFTFPTWPNGESPNSCYLPPVENQAQPPAITPIARADAEPHCAAITDPVQKDHCIGDVAVTGEIGFAQTYLRSQLIAANRVPAMPTQIFPKDDAAGLAGPITFRWNTAADADGDTVTYRHCVWSVNKNYNGNECVAVPGFDGSTGDGADSVCTWLFILLAIALFVVLLRIAIQNKQALPVWIALALLFALVLVYLFCGKGFGRMTTTVSDLRPGEAYFWKVLADDGKGGTTESETLRFELKK